MPTYNYQCDACGHLFEQFQSITAKTLKKCPRCGKPKLKRTIGLTYSESCKRIAENDVLAVIDPPLNNKTKDMRVPDKEEIAQLPLGAQVAFAARCARRVQPLFTFYWLDAPKKHIETLEKAISIAERFASGDKSVAAGAAYAAAAARAACDIANRYQAIPKMMGRMEIICENPKILVDAAHNAASIRALIHAIGQHIPYDSMIIIFGCNSDKDVRGMLTQLQYGADKVIFTRSNSSKAVSPYDLAEMYTEICGKMCQAVLSLPEALRIAKNVIVREDLICITGSFFLVGQAKEYFPKSGLANQVDFTVNTWNDLYLKEIRRDFEKLIIVAKKEKWNDERTIPPEFFGSLWPEGKPEGWPEETLRSGVFSFEQPALEFYIKPGNASKETILEVFNALSEYHRAAGGFGLEFTFDGQYVYARDGVNV